MERDLLLETFSTLNKWMDALKDVSYVVFQDKGFRFQITRNGSKKIMSVHVDGITHKNITFKRLYEFEDKFTSTDSSRLYYVLKGKAYSCLNHKRLLTKKEQYENQQCKNVGSLHAKRCGESIGCKHPNF